MSYKKLWFGTRHHAQWVKMPLRGADMSPQGWGTDGTYLSGGGFVRQSADSHRQYIFEYGGASTRQDASIMQAYRDGVYSMSPDDLIYFIDPLIYDQNILPKRWAQPGINAPESRDTTSPWGSLTSTPSFLVDGLPLRGATITSLYGNLMDFELSDPNQLNRVYVPLPEGRTVNLKAWGSWSGTNGVYVRRQNLGGSWGLVEKVDDTLSLSGVQGFILGGIGTFDLYGLRATIDAPIDMWTPGLGHSGCRFVGEPTWVANSGVGGGQIGYAATLKEVGDWITPGVTSPRISSLAPWVFTASDTYPGAVTLSGPPGLMTGPGLLGVPIGV